MDRWSNEVKDMTHIVITAGGTIEDIDEVRKITNTSTGRLGVELSEALVDYMKSNLPQEAYTLHYIATQTAVRPREHQNLRLYEVTDSQSVLSTVKEIFSNHTIRYFIHSMAISDFTTGAIIPLDQLAVELVGALMSAPQAKWLELLGEKLRNPEAALDQSKKISSQSDLLLSLKRTPKVISEIKKYDPKVFLVGFKLLKNVEENELIHAAQVLAEQNGCDLVLANDLSTVQKGAHLGLLVKEGQVIGRYEGKVHIATGIINEMFKRRDQL